MSQIKVIKRYANRKLYDTEESVYITLKQIGDSIAAGRTVTVIDNVTKEDVTGHILLSTIVETSEDLNGQALTLSAIIKAGGLSKYVESLKTTNV